MRDDDFFFLLPEQNWRSFIRSWRRRRALEILYRDLIAVSRERATESGMRHLALYGFDGNSHLINIFGSPEREAMDLIFTYLEKQNLIRGAAIDVGANVGMHSIRFAKRFDTVFAFEPHPITFELLQMNLKRYAPGSRAFKIGAGSSRGTSTLYENRFQNMGAPSLIKSATVFAEHEVQVERLDDIDDLRDKPIGLMKVDTEGHELEVFKGAINLIGANRPVLLFEDFKSKQGSASETIELLRSLGYSRFLIPEIFPLGSTNRVLRLIQIMRRGASMGLIACDFSADRGYDLIMAVPDAPASARH